MSLCGGRGGGGAGCACQCVCTVVFEWRSDCMLITSQAPPRHISKRKLIPASAAGFWTDIYAIVAELILVALTYNDLQHIAERLKLGHSSDRFISWRREAGAYPISGHIPLCGARFMHGPVRPLLPLKGTRLINRVLTAESIPQNQNKSYQNKNSTLLKLSP